MKKYFVKETGEELEFGDIIAVSLEKELEDGHVSVEKELKFLPETADALVELGVVDVEEDKKECKKKCIIEFDDLDVDEEELLIEKCIDTMSKSLENAKKVIGEIDDMLLNWGKSKEDERKDS